MTKHYLQLLGGDYLASVAAYPEPRIGEPRMEIATTGDPSQAMAFPGLETAVEMARALWLWTGKDFKACKADLPEPAAVPLELLHRQAPQELGLDLAGEGYAGDHPEGYGGPELEHTERGYVDTGCSEFLQRIERFSA